jgi:membrane-associated protease RseP (regulator of RpoE activity)
MNEVYRKMVKIVVLPVLVAGLASSVASAEEKSFDEEEIKHVVIEAREVAKEWADKIREWKGGSKSTTYIGVVIESVPSVLRDYVDLPKGVGLLLPRIAKDGPADKAGLVDNDILVKFDDQLVINYNQLSALLDLKGAGATVPVTILRKGEEMTFDVTLEERVRKGAHFIHPDAPEVPGVPDPDEMGHFMEKIEEWIPGSVRVFVDENEQVHVDLEDLKDDMKGLQTKIAKIRMIHDDTPALVEEHGEHGARTTLVHVMDKNINYTSDKGRVILDSSPEGKHVTVWDENDELLYQGLLPENYQAELPAKAVKLIELLDDIQLDVHEHEIKVELNADSIEPVTLLDEDI